MFSWISMTSDPGILFSHRARPQPGKKRAARFLLEWFMSRCAIEWNCQLSTILQYFSHLPLLPRPTLDTQKQWKLFPINSIAQHQSKAQFSSCSLSDPFLLVLSLTFLSARFLSSRCEWIFHIYLLMMNYEFVWGHSTSKAAHLDLESSSSETNWNELHSRNLIFIFRWWLAACAAHKKKEHRELTNSWSRWSCHAKIIQQQAAMRRVNLNSLNWKRWHFPSHYQPVLLLTGAHCVCQPHHTTHDWILISQLSTSVWYDKFIFFVSRGRHRRPQLLMKVEQRLETCHVDGEVSLWFGAFL